MTKAEQFCKLNGIPYYNASLFNIESCIPITYSFFNTTFTDAKSILEVMMKRDDWSKFLETVGTSRVGYDVVDIDYILNPDKLLDEAIKWCEENKEA